MRLVLQRVETGVAGVTSLELHEATRRGNPHSRLHDYRDWVQYVVLLGFVKLTTFVSTSICRYNGTPRGVPNCTEGGCKRCNEGGASAVEGFEECLCIHAEENALLEAGRERVGKGAVLYCNT